VPQRPTSSVRLIAGGTRLARTRRMNAPRFSLSGAVADTDETVPSDLLHPALVLLVEVGLHHEIVRVIVPTLAWTEDNAVLRAGRRLMPRPARCFGRPRTHGTAAPRPQ